MKNIGEIIATNRKKFKMTQPELAERLAEEGIHISYKSISGWEKGTSEPGIAAFLTICKILEIPDIQESYFGLNPMNPFSLLNEEGKEKLKEYGQLLLETHRFDRHIAELVPFATRQIRIFDVKASAGYGNFLDEARYEWTEVGNEVPASADFGIQLSGDSMTPRFIDKQIVWVHQQETLLSGEIGIFYYNGSAYCKKLRKDESGLYLVSLNPKYEPIPVHENDTFRIFGKVVG